MVVFVSVLLTLGLKDHDKLLLFLPPAYVVRRKGNVLTRVCPSICLSTGGRVSPQSSRWGGGSGPAGGGDQVQLVGGGQVQLLGRGQVQLSGGIRSSQLGGLRSSWPEGGQVQPVGGVRSSWQGGSVQLGGRSAKIGQQNELSLHTGGMPLAFTARSQSTVPLSTTHLG